MIHPSRGQHLGAGAMAILVHGLFFVLLVFSVTWQNPPEQPVYAELWERLPPLPEAPKSPPEPVKPAAPLQPLPAPPAPKPQADTYATRKEEERPRLQAKAQQQADIEVKRRQAQPAKRQQPEPKKAEVRHQAAERQQPNPKKAKGHDQAVERQQQQVEARRKEAARLAQEQALRQLNETLARELQEDLAKEARLLQSRAESQAQAAARLKMIEDYRNRIRNKIYSYLRLPPNLSGNPEVVYQVRLLPDGEVLQLTLLKSSGQPAYDRQVELAILKASPFPLPPDRELASAFRENLILKFRPHNEEGAGG